MQAWSLTDVGRLRKENQDNVYFRIMSEDSQAFCIICDGMGGAKAGNVASSMTVEAVRESIEGSFRQQMTREYMRSALISAVEDANHIVYEKSLEKPELFGMGTTLTALLADNGSAVVINVGDSRTYKISSGKIVQLTKDHSLAAALLESGNITPEQFKTFPNKNIITRALGTEKDVECDLFDVTAAAGDKFILCSDGLSNMVSDEEMLLTIESKLSPEKACKRLIAMANDAGGSDNISVALLYI